MTRNRENETRESAARAGGPLVERAAFAALAARTQAIVAAATTRDEMLARLCECLAQTVPHYNWVGFYLVDPAKPDELVLGPFVGKATEHARIPFGRGICGQSAAREQTVLVQDVTRERNYLACSVETKAEIVVPIFVAGRMLAQLDIDSHAVAPFSALDEQFLEDLCRRVGERW
jgi:L-methionine (R)-S-oxide reductase